MRALAAFRPLPYLHGESLMGLLDTATTFFMRRRIGSIEAALAEPIRVQETQFATLLEAAGKTEYGRAHGLADARTYEEFRNRVPIRGYEDFWPFIERTMQGERDVLWPGRTKLFSKSSGTTGQRSKFIPVTEDSLHGCHYQGGKDMITLYLHNHPGSDVLVGKTLAVGGSLDKNPLQADSWVGDVSALIMNHLPAWAQRMRSPRLETAILPNWEEKLERIAQEASKENITSLSGVPTWMLLLLEKVLDINNATDLREVWPDLEVFIHGAVSFKPYRQVFTKFVKGAPLNTMEVYNASEGYFAQQDQQPGPEGEMALMPHYGIFYEFIPADAFRRGSDLAIPLSEVEAGQDYALVITTNGGLWRYLIGDTVRFTSTSPYRIVISGRTKHFINAFGEEVVVENAEAAVTFACQQTGTAVRNFTVAPVYMGGSTQACHEWLIEFEGASPTQPDTFIRLIDERLRQVNSDYDAKRQADLALKAPELHILPDGTFYRWLKSRGRLGGQNKVPRLSNTREYVEQILEFVKAEA